jgi:transcriptional regulator with XRE-family HTH domain
MNPISDDDTADGSRGDALPERMVTPNMLIAFNVARWRAAAGLTQDQLGERLGGWTKTAVSAAERSWDGKRVRQFDADLVVRLAAILGVPVRAFLLPPPDDGEAFRYAVRLADGAVLPMREYFGIVMPELGADGPRAYLDAVAAAAARYLDYETAGSLAATVKDLAAERQLEAALDAARADGQALAALAASLDSLITGNSLLRDVLARALGAQGETVRD